MGIIATVEFPLQPGKKDEFVDLLVEALTSRRPGATKGMNPFKRWSNTVALVCCWLKNGRQWTITKPITNGG